MLIDNLTRMLFHHRSITAQHMIL